METPRKLLVMARRGDKVGVTAKELRYCARIGKAPSFQQCDARADR
jgi:hypothetical protein